MQPSHEDFRKIGFDGAAVQYPLSRFGLSVRAAHNGVTLDYLMEKMPETWRYAPNLYMQEWYEVMGELMVKDKLTVRDEDGRWWGPARLVKEYQIVWPFKVASSTTPTP